MAELKLAKQYGTQSGGCACVYSTNVGGSQANSTQVLYTQAGPCPCPDEYPGGLPEDTDSLIDYTNDNVLREKQKQALISEGTILNEISKYYRGFKNVAKAEVSKIKKSLSNTGRNLLGVSKKEIKNIVSNKKNSLGSLRQLSLKEREALKVNILENSKRFAQGFNNQTPTSFATKRDYYVKYKKNRKATESRKQNHQGLYGLTSKSVGVENGSVSPVEPTAIEPVVTKPTSSTLVKTPQEVDRQKEVDRQRAIKPEAKPSKPTSRY